MKQKIRAEILSYVGFFFSGIRYVCRCLSLGLGPGFESRSSILGDTSLSNSDEDKLREKEVLCTQVQILCGAPSTYKKKPVKYRYRGKKPKIFVGEL